MKKRKIFLKLKRNLEYIQYETSKFLIEVCMRKIVVLPIFKIKSDDTQPRKLFDEESMCLLSETILNKGVEAPIHVRPSKKDPSLFIIIEGERRYRAAERAGLTELPCIVEENLNTLEILEMQLRSDCTKEKLTVEERDGAIFQYYLMLENIDPVKDLGLIINTKGDWKQSYVSRSVGISPYIVRMAINKEEFHIRNKDFKIKLENSIKDADKKQELKKKMNIALEETARVRELKDDDALRKHVINKFVQQEDADSKKLRAKLKEARETGKISSKKGIDEILDADENKLDNIIDNYIFNVTQLTENFLLHVAAFNNDAIDKKKFDALKHIFSETLTKLK